MSLNSKINPEKYNHPCLIEAKQYANSTRNQPTELRPIHNLSMFVNQMMVISSQICTTKTSDAYQTSIYFDLCL